MPEPSTAQWVQGWNEALPFQLSRVKVTQSCPTLCDPMDHTVHGILQTRILEWGAFSSPGDLPNPGIEPMFPTLQVDFLPAEPQGKPPKNTVLWLSTILIAT